MPFTRPIDFSNANKNVSQLEGYNGIKMCNTNGGIQN